MVRTKLYKQYLNRFIQGEQYIHYQNINGEEHILDMPKEFFWQHKGVYNLIQSFYAEASRFLKGDNLYKFAETLIPYQKAYNNLRNRIEDYQERLVNGILAVEDGSMDTDSLEAEGICAGKVLVYRQGATPPQYLQHDVKLLEVLISYENKILNDMNDIAHKFITEATR